MEMEENLIIDVSESNRVKKKKKLLLIKNINLIFHIYEKIIPKFINVPK